MMLSLLARTGTLHGGVLVQGRKNGKPVWVLFDGPNLVRAQHTILARHADVLAACTAQMPAETNGDTVVLMGVRLVTQDTDIPNTVRALAWSYATPSGWHTTPVLPALAEKVYAHG